MTFIEKRKKICIVFPFTLNIIMKKLAFFLSFWLILGLGISQAGFSDTNGNEYEEAINDYDKAIELYSNDVSFYYIRGLINVELGKYEEAINDYDEAIELDPDNSYCYCNREVAYEKMGEYEEAINDYNKAIELDPNCKIAIENLKKLKNF